MKVMSKTTGKAERKNSVKRSISQAKHQKLLQSFREAMIKM
jgi:hypothetical protein